MKYNGENLQEVLEAHRRWVMNEDGWTENDRANFRYANLSGVNLYKAVLYEADLYRANLYGAFLRGADLRGAILYNANLKKADLRDANMSKADLIFADLSQTNLRKANLRGASLNNATLRTANLYEADLTGAVLLGAQLHGANLYKTSLEEATIPHVYMACPNSGAFIGWKMCLMVHTCQKGMTAEKVIVKLLIPEDAERSSATTGKCRASCATILEIQTLDGTVLSDANGDTDIVACSMCDPNFLYRPGETVRPTKPFDPDRWNECGSGIHFFIDRQEAVDYQV